MRRWIFRFQPLFRVAFRAVLLFRSIYTTPAGIMQGEPGQRRTAVHLVHRSARIFHWPFSCRSALLCRFKVVFFAVTPRPICGAGSVFLFVQKLFSYRDIRRTFFRGGEFSFGFPWVRWKRGSGLWINLPLSAKKERL